MSLWHADSRRLRIIIVLFAAAGILLSVLNRPAGFGFLAGELLSVVIYEWNVYYWNRVMDRRSAGTWTGFPHFLINFALMGALLLFAVYNPGILNIFTAALGLTAVKSAIIINELLKGKEAVK